MAVLYECMLYYLYQTGLYCGCVGLRFMKLCMSARLTVWPCFGLSGCVMLILCLPTRISGGNSSALCGSHF
uniref:Uncharacterized protein n=1 Tax=Anguilla anguilla TaxID=7936 RepID=A0A0E9WZN6_ANGAN